MILNIVMLALFVKVPMMWRLRMIRSFSADHGPLLHISAGHARKETKVYKNHFKGCS